MTWLGKILTFLVLIGSVVWAYFSVSAYATRTNWKVRADNFEKAYKDSEANRQRELRAYEADREALVRMYKGEQGRADDLAKSLEDLSAAGRKVDADYKKIEQDFRDSDVQAKILQANVKTIQDELADTRKRNNLLEDERVRLVLAKEAADRERLRAENESKLSRSIADENARKVETLTSLVTELRTTGGSSTATVLRSIQKTPSPLPENTRGSVVRDIAGEFVQIDIGIDAGLEPGSRLDVYREGTNPRYLGTLTVTKSIYPKEAVAEFKPASGRPISQLRPEDLPRKGDTVAQLGGGLGIR